MKKLELSQNTSRNVKTVQLLWKTVWQFLKKLNIELPYDPIVLPLVIYPRESKTYIHTKTCPWMFIAALFIIAKKWKQSMKKRWIHQKVEISIKWWMDKQNTVYLYSGTLFSTKKEWSTDTWCHRVSLENIKLNERSQTPKAMSCMLPYNGNVQDR